MTDESKIRAAWEAYHGPGDGYIPDPTDDYERGYRDGVESVAAEVRQAIDDLEVAVYAPDQSSISVRHACDHVRHAIRAVEDGSKAVPPGDE